MEGDEGEDMGMVVQSWAAPANSPPVVNNSLNINKYNSNSADVDYLTGDPIYPKVIRPASDKEVQYMHNAQAQVEIKCTEVARHKVTPSCFAKVTASCVVHKVDCFHVFQVQEHRLPMSIVDSEYQFDRKKLTFYYDSNERCVAVAKARWTLPSFSWHRRPAAVLVRDLLKWRFRRRRRTK